MQVVELNIKEKVLKAVEAIPAGATFEDVMEEILFPGEVEARWLSYCLWNQRQSGNFSGRDHLQVKLFMQAL